MGVGAVLEPLVVVGLLFGGTYINRNSSYKFAWNAQPRQHAPRVVLDEEEPPTSPASWATDDPLLSTSQISSPPLLAVDAESKWHTRELDLWGFKGKVTTPNSRVFKDRWFSRVIRKFPFLQEAFYWALIYWVYQLGRAFTAVTLVEGTVHVARQHALELIHLEQRLHIFWELPIQHYFLSHPALLIWINRIYSFIHIPGTILFLVWLYHYTSTTSTQLLNNRQLSRDTNDSGIAGPRLYEARRRTMATCNLIAFIVFTIWPCMPPRLLSNPDVRGPSGDEARSYGFVDTVHGDGGEGSVWTQNRFCNQYAAMPSLHFGYSLLIGLTIFTIPLPETLQQRRRSISVKGSRISMPLPSFQRLACVVVGVLYPLTILVAIIATANHFILDAVAGALVCGLAWNGNRVLLNLLPLEDWFLWCIRVHFPERGVAADWEEGLENERVGGKNGVER